MTKKEFFPGMTHGEKVQMLVHMHFRPNAIVAARRKCQAKIDAGVKPERHDDYRARIAEYDTSLAKIQETWIAATDDVRIAAHERIAQLDATGMPLKGGN